MISFFKTIVYIPLYNFLVLLLNVSWIDIGIATVILTILVKIILYPLSKKALVTQLKMKEKEGELNAIKEKYKDSQEQALKIMEFYRTNKINPFSSIFTVFIQIPIIYSLYYIFSRSGLPMVNHDLLYSFIKAPEQISALFLGFWDITKKSAVLAVLAGLSSFLQMHFASQSASNNDKTAGNSEDFSTIMMKQMKFTMPVIVFLISWRISGVIALYWLVSNLLGIAQDLYIRKQMKIVSPNSV